MESNRSNRVRDKCARTAGAELACAFYVMSRYRVCLCGVQDAAMEVTWNMLFSGLEVDKVAKPFETCAQQAVVTVATLCRW
jgi:hypothetical protein